MRQSSSPIRVIAHRGIKWGESIALFVHWSRWWKVQKIYNEYRKWFDGESLIIPIVLRRMSEHSLYNNVVQLPMHHAESDVRKKSVISPSPPLSWPSANDTYTRDLPRAILFESVVPMTKRSQPRAGIGKCCRPKVNLFSRCFLPLCKLEPVGIGNRRHWDGFWTDGESIIRKSLAFCW